MNNKKGKRAEDKVCDWLVKHGCKIIEQNWRNRYCEIDIIAKYKQELLFVEVKYRYSDAYGSALEYVDNVKSAQLLKAASHYLHENDLDISYRIFAAGLNSKFTVVDFVELIY